MQTQTINSYHPITTPAHYSTPRMDAPSANKSSAWGGVSSSPAPNPAPWGSVSSPAPQSLKDVMSEELAEQLQTEENQTHMSEVKQQSDEIDIDALMAAESSGTQDDFLLAQMLQHEFDREHDAMLDKEEQKWNGTSKVKISFQNYRSLHPRTQEEEDEEDEEEVWEHRVKDVSMPSFNKAGFAGKGKNIVTKHDATLSGQKNAQRVMDQFPPDFETGDGLKHKMRLPNHVYNKLKRHSQQENKRSHKLHEKKEFSTTALVVDAKTRLIMYKLVNNGILESVEGNVSAGKESVVFHGTGGRMSDALVPPECAIKVFKTTLSEFKNRFQYVRGDVRFMGDDYKKLNPRRIVKIWAEKELANLKKMESCGIPCPRPVVLKKHVLVMEFIGRDQVPAPKLQETRLSPEEYELAYHQCLQNMKKMFRECALVHADLSPYNMLWSDGTLYFIDVAQAVDIMHPMAMEFLLRDCQHVSKYFSSVGVHDVMSDTEMFNEITGLGLKGTSQDFIAQIEHYEKKEEKVRSGTSTDEYAFDFFFEKARLEREEKKRRVEELFEESDSDDEEVGEDAIFEEKAKLDPEVEEKLHLVLSAENAVLAVDEAEDCGIGAGNSGTGVGDDNDDDSAK